MTNTFLIHAPHNQSVQTEEGYEGRPIVYSNLAYYETKEILGEHAKLGEAKPPF